MHRAVTAVLLALAATAAAGADEARAPLADTKQQLQQLQKDQGGAKSGQGDPSLKGALPQLQNRAPGQDLLPPASLDPNQAGQARAKKNEAKRNWLVDGYDKLDPKATAGKTGESLLTSQAANEEKDEEDHQGQSTDLIQLYENDAKAKGAKATKDKDADNKPEHPAADPLAPFLKEWLANSPVRDAALAATPKNEGNLGSTPEAGPASTIAPVSPLPAAAGPSVAPNPGGATPADNPYLLTLTIPNLPGSPPGAAPAMPTPASDSLSIPLLPKPAANGPADAVAPPVKPDLRKPPPSQVDDDKKYFPQLKRF
jgi:hypothetical protein